VSLTTKDGNDSTLKTPAVTPVPFFVRGDLAVAEIAAYVTASLPRMFFAGDLDTLEPESLLETRSRLN